MASTNIAIIVAIVTVAMSMSLPSGQITTACANSIISTLTPCMNFLTGSTSGGGSPTAGCCDALGSLVADSTECACLIVTGNVPLSLPINRTLSVTLPRACKSKSVPLHCKATAAPLPSPGSLADAPTLPPLPPFASGEDLVPSSSPSAAPTSTIPPSAAPTSRTPSSAAPASSTPPSSVVPASPPAFATSPTNRGLKKGQRPLVVPNSVPKIISMPSLSLVLMLLVFGIMLLNK